MPDYSDTSRDNTTAYAHPQETNLLNLHKAMEYDAAGKPVVRVRVDGGQVTISGDVVVDEVGLTAETLAALETTTVLQGTDPWIIGDGGGSISIDDGGNAITVDGTVNIGTMPNVTVNQPIAVTDNGGSLTVDGNVGVTGDVNVTQGTDPWVVSGNVNATIVGSPVVGSNKPFYLEIQQGLIPGYAFNHKFGAAPLRA